MREASCPCPSLGLGVPRGVILQPRPWGLSSRASPCLSLPLCPGRHCLPERVSSWAESPSQVWGLGGAALRSFSGKPVKFSWRSSAGHSESCRHRARASWAGLAWMAPSPSLFPSLCLCLSLSHTHTCPSGGHIQTPVRVLPGGTGRCYLPRPSGTPQEALTWPPEAVCRVRDAGCRWTQPCARAQTSLWSQGGNLGWQTLPLALLC